MRFLPRLLSRAVRKGHLTLTGPDGRVWRFGDGDGPRAAITIHDPSLDWRLVLNPELKAGEAWMDGGLTVEGGDIYALLEVFFVNKPSFDLTPTQIFWRKLSRGARRALTDNTLLRARANAQAHYDIGNDLYRLMLDEDMQYSCAYWPEGVTTLRDAQTAKKRHIAAKLGLRPGMRVLDIGCGWGGMALYMAAVTDVEVVGVTLAAEQLSIAQARAQAAGLSDRVRFDLCDYRQVTQRFDRVVSVGMLEHVGVSQLLPYFVQVRDRLAPDGVALIHSITTKSPRGFTGPFIRKYIFPGGYAPSISETVSAIEHAGLWTLDVEVWRLHYARTLREWRARFLAAQDRLPPAYDARFRRMWDFYLAACIGSFEHASSSVMQIQLGRTRDAAPLTRDYVAVETERLRAREAAALPALWASTEAAFGV